MDKLKRQMPNAQSADNNQIFPDFLRFCKAIASTFSWLNLENLDDLISSSSFFSKFDVTYL